MRSQPAAPLHRLNRAAMSMGSMVATNATVDDGTSSSQLWRVAYGARSSRHAVVPMRVKLESNRWSVSSHHGLVFDKSDEHVRNRAMQMTKAGTRTYRVRASRSIRRGAVIKLRCVHGLTPTEASFLLRWCQRRRCGSNEIWQVNASSTVTHHTMQPMALTNAFYLFPS